jgi:hypothetical protein
MKTVSYLRKGRKLRASGSVMDRGPSGTVKVKPARDSWGCVWLSPEEIEAGKEKPAYQAREKSEAAPIKRERKPKPIPLPRWKELVNRVRTFEVDHHPSGWPAVKMGFLTEIADELEKAQGLFRGNI